MYTRDISDVAHCPIEFERYQRRDRGYEPVLKYVAIFLFTA